MHVLNNPLVAEILETWPGAKVKMKEPNSFEIEGMYAASDIGGAYLEGIGKTDLVSMSQDEWMTFIERIVRGYEEKCMELYSPNGEIPFPPAD